MQKAIEIQDYTCYGLKFKVHRQALFIKTMLASQFCCLLTWCPEKAKKVLQLDSSLDPPLQLPPCDHCLPIGSEEVIVYAFTFSTYLSAPLLGDPSLPYLQLKGMVLMASPSHKVIHHRAVPQSHLLPPSVTGTTRPVQTEPWTPGTNSSLILDRHLLLQLNPLLPVSQVHRQQLGHYAFVAVNVVKLVDRVN